MQVLKRTLDLEDELAEMDERVDEVEAQIDSLVDEAIEAEANGNDDRVDAIRSEVAGHEQSITGIRGYRNAIDRALHGDPEDPEDTGWDGSEVVIKELTGQEARIVKAEAQDRAERRGLSQERANDIRDIEFLKRAVVSTPAGAPEPSDVHGLPNLLFDWLVTRANNLNSVGDFDMGNSSLRDRMEERSS